MILYETHKKQLKRGLMHVRKVSSQISLRSSHSLIRDDTFRLKLIFLKIDFHETKNIMKAESVVPYKPVWAAQAYLRLTYIFYMYIHTHVESVNSNVCICKHIQIYILTLSHFGLKETHKEMSQKN